MEKITAESKKQLEQLSKNVDYKLVDLDNNLQVLYKQNQQKVTKLLEKFPIHCGSWILEHYILSLKLLLVHLMKCGKGYSMS